MAQKGRLEHPLHNRPLVGIESWEHWLTLWEKAKTAEELISLLHYSSQLRLRGEPAEQERLKFWLKVADGHALDEIDASHRQLPSYGRLYESVFGEEEATYETVLPPATNSSFYGGTKLRGAVAKKAWQLLCTSFFDRGTIYWARLPEVFPAVLEFFDPNERWYNLPSSHTQRRDERHHATAEAFVTKFARATWRAQPDGAVNKDEEFIAKEKIVLAQMKSAQAKVLGILCITGGYGFLGHILPGVSPRQMKLLEAWALAGHQEGEPLSMERQYETIEEAVVHKNRLAEILVLNGLRIAHRLRASEEA